VTTPAPKPEDAIRVLVPDKDNPEIGQVVQGILLDTPEDDSADAPPKPKRAGGGRAGNAESANGCTDKIKPDPAGPVRIYQRIGSGSGRKPYKYVGHAPILMELTEDWWHSRFPHGGRFRLDSPLVDGGNGGRIYQDVDGLHPSMLSDQQRSGAPGATPPAVAALTAELAELKTKIATKEAASAAARIDWPAMIAAGTPILSALLARQDQSGAKVAAAITAANAPLVAALERMSNQPPAPPAPPASSVAEQMDAMLGAMGKLQQMQTEIRGSSSDDDDGSKGLIDQIIGAVLGAKALPGLPGLPAPAPAAAPAPGAPAPAPAPPPPTAEQSWPPGADAAETAARLELMGIEADAIANGAPFTPGQLWDYAQSQGATSYASALEIAGRYGLRKAQT